jgi:hypothetical protein
MATMHASPYELHDHAGARWLATAATPILLAILAVFAMLAYPHI